MASTSLVRIRTTGEIQPDKFALQTIGILKRLLPPGATRPANPRIITPTQNTITIQILSFSIRSNADNPKHYTHSCIYKTIQSITYNHIPRHYSLLLDSIGSLFVRLLRVGHGDNRVSLCCRWGREPSSTPSATTNEHLPEFNSPNKDERHSDYRVHQQKPTRNINLLTNNTPLPSNRRMTEHDRIETRNIQANRNRSHAKNDGPKQHRVIPKIPEDIRIGVPIDAKLVTAHIP